MSLITQLHVANHGLFFEPELKKRYNFSKYENIYEPTLFFGVVHDDNINIINNHKGFKLVHCITPLDEMEVKKLNKENLHLFYGPYIDKDFNNVIIKELNIEFKDYSMFKPNVLGNKIYSYMRDQSEFKKSTLDSIQNKIPYEIIYGGTGIHVHTYLPIDELKNKFYNNCFLNINLSGRHGFVTIREMGFMGRKTIMNSLYNFPSVINYRDEGHIVEIIMEESKKIGTIQEPFNPHTIDNEWLNVNYWKS